MTRQPEFILIIGAPETGKTTFSYKIITQLKRKTLFVLVRNSKGLPLIRKEQINQLPNRKGLYYIEYDSTDNDFWPYIEKHFVNGSIVLDDASYFLADMRAFEFKRMVMRNRHSNNDVVWLSHGLSEVPPNFFTYVSKVILFNTTDSFERSKQKIPDFEFYKQAIVKVKQMAATNKHAKLIFHIR